LEWREQVGEDIVARQVIGPAGGVIELRGTGIQIHFPEGTFSEDILIEVRALEGSVVAFEFGASGLTFGVPIEVRIDIRELAGPWSELLGIHFEGGSRSQVTTLETFPIRYDGGSILLEISQEDIDLCRCDLFGYAVASG